MKICPFCGKSFEYKDLLFFGEMKASGGSAYVQDDQNQSVTATMSTDMFNMFNFDDVSSVPSMEEAQEETAAAADDIYGVWRDDDVYNEYIKRYHGSKDIRKSRFAVRWSADEASHGIGKVSRWLDPNTKQIPFAIALCDEDMKKYAKDAEIRTLTRIMCPSCHCEIKVQYLGAPEANCHTAVLVGGKRCGKTQYRIAMMQNLRRFLATEYGLCDKIELFSASNEFYKVEEEEFRGAYMPGATPIKLLFPLVFEVCPVHNRDDRRYVSLYDLPGEVFGSEEENEDAAGNADAISFLMENQGIAQADSALFIIDAAQLHSAIHEKYKTETIPIPEQNVPAQEEAAYTEYAEEMYGGEEENSGENAEEQRKGLTVQFYKEQNITIPLQALQDAGVNNNIKRIAVIVSKADLLFEVPSSKFNTSRDTMPACKHDDCHTDGIMQGHKGGVYIPCINQVSNNVIEEIIQSQNGGSEAILVQQKNSLKEDIRHRVGIRPENVEDDIKFFAVSTFEYKPEEAKYIPCVEASMNRHRILEPVLYLLAKWKVVPIKEVEASHGTDLDDDMPWWKRIIGGKKKNSSR